MTSFLERRHRLSRLGKKDAGKKPSSGFHSGSHLICNDKTCTCTSSAWDVDQGIMALRSRCLSCGILPLGITQGRLPPLLRFMSADGGEFCGFRTVTLGRDCGCRVAISAKHLTSTGRAVCTSQLSVACSEMTEVSRLRFDCDRHDANAHRS